MAGIVKSDSAAQGRLAARFLHGRTGRARAVRRPAASGPLRRRGSLCRALGRPNSRQVFVCPPGPLESLLRRKQDLPEPVSRRASIAVISKPVIRRGIELRRRQDAAQSSSLQSFNAAHRDSADAVTLEASVERGTTEFGDHRLEALQTIVERKAGVLPKDDDQNLFGGAKHRRDRMFRTHRRVRGRAPSLPFSDGLWIEPEPEGGFPIGFRFSLLDLAPQSRRRASAGMSLPGHGFQLASSL